MGSHRCSARRPPAAISTSTQRDFCLTAAHPACPYYVTARETRAAALAADHIRPERLDRARFHPAVRPLPTALEPAGARIVGSAAPSLAARRPRMSAAFLGVASLVIFIAALAVLAAALLPEVSSGGAAASAGTAGVSGVRASPSGRLTATSRGTPRPSASARPSASPSAPVTTPGTPVGTTQYTVRDGDTLRTIARRFGTTVAQLRELNELGQPPRIAPGQVIFVPAA